MCLKCNHSLGEAFNGLTFNNRRCFYVLAKEGKGKVKQIQKLKIRISDEVLEHHVLVEACTQMLAILKENQKILSSSNRNTLVSSKKKLQINQTSTWKKEIIQKSDMQDYPTFLFNCSECKVIILHSSEIDHIVIEDRMCKSISLSLNRRVRHHSNCSIS